MLQDLEPEFSRQLLCQLAQATQAGVLEAYPRTLGLATLMGLPSDGIKAALQAMPPAAAKRLLEHIALEQAQAMLKVKLPSTWDLEEFSEAEFGGLKNIVMIADSPVEPSSPSQAKRGI